MNNTEFVIALLGTSTITSIIGAIITAVLNRRLKKAQVKDIQADVIEKTTQVNSKLIESINCLYGKVNKLEKDIDVLERNYEESERKVKLLTRLVGRILDKMDGAVPIEEIICIMNVSAVDRSFLFEVVRGERDTSNRGGIGNDPS